MVILLHALVASTRDNTHERSSTPSNNILLTTYLRYSRDNGDIERKIIRPNTPVETFVEKILSPPSDFDLDVSTVSDSEFAQKQSVERLEGPTRPGGTHSSDSSEIRVVSSSFARFHELN